MERLNLFWIITLITILAAGSPEILLAKGSSKKYTISGEVRDTNNKPIDSILVQVFRNGGEERIDKIRTGKDGSYGIDFDEGSPISISYSGVEYDRAYVGGLYGCASQLINKTMYFEGKTPSYANSEIFMSLNHELAYASTHYLPTGSLLFELSDFSKLSAKEMGHWGVVAWAQVTENKMSNIQAYLGDMGYYEGPVNGVIECQMVKAVKDYSYSKTGIAGKGLDAKSLTKLEKVASDWSESKEQLKK